MSHASANVTLARWRKFGQDRLYVSYADGTKLGYWDLVAGEAHPEDPELEQIVASASAARSSRSDAAWLACPRLAIAAGRAESSYWPDGAARAAAAARG